MDLSVYKEAAHDLSVSTIDNSGSGWPWPLLGYGAGIGVSMVAAGRAYKAAEIACHQFMENPAFASITGVCVAASVAFTLGASVAGGLSVSAIGDGLEWLTSKSEQQ